MPRRKKEQRFNGNRPVRKSEYSPNRECYMDKRGNYVYSQWVEDGKDNWVLKPICVIPVDDAGANAEWTILLDDMDCEEDRRDNLIRKYRDPAFEAAQSRYNNGESDGDGDLVADPWDIAAYRMRQDQDIADLIEPEKDAESEDRPLMKRLLAAMDKLTPAQRDLIYDHLGACRQLEEIRRDEEERTGKRITQQAMHNRWDKIITRLCKEMGAPKPRKKRESGDE